VSAILVGSTLLFATSCDNPTDPQSRSGSETEPVRGNHGNDTPIKFSNGQVIIKGENLLPAEWTGVTTKVAGALNTNPNDEGWPAWFGGLINAYGPNITIIVKYTDDFANYKTTRKGNTIYINLNIINDSDALFDALGNAFGAIDGDPNIDIIGSASARDTVHMASVLEPVDANEIG